MQIELQRNRVHLYVTGDTSLCDLSHSIQVSLLWLFGFRTRVLGINRCRQSSGDCEIDISAEPQMELAQLSANSPFGKLMEGFEPDDLRSEYSKANWESLADVEVENIPTIADLAWATADSIVESFANGAKKLKCNLRNQSLQIMSDIDLRPTSYDMHAKASSIVG